MNYYYADATQKPVGPYTLAGLRDLRYQGVISDDTFVIEHGGSKWVRFSEVLNPPSPPAQDAVGTPTPPAPEALKPAGPTTGTTPRPLTELTGKTAPSAAAPNPDKVGIFTAIFCFVCCFPIGFMEWGQTAKGWVWFLLSCFTGVGFIVAMVDYWMCYVAQKRRRLGEWEFFPQ